MQLNLTDKVLIGIIILHGTSSNQKRIILWLAIHDTFSKMTVFLSYFSVQDSTKLYAGRFLQLRPMYTQYAIVYYAIMHNYYTIHNV